MCTTSVKRHVSDVIVLPSSVFALLRLYIVRFGQLRFVGDSFEEKPIIRLDFVAQEVSVWLIVTPKSICAIESLLA